MCECQTLLAAVMKTGQPVRDVATRIVDRRGNRIPVMLNATPFRATGDTIGGLVTAAIGHLPEAGEELTLGRFGFRVARADSRRLHALHVSVHPEAEEA